MENCINTKHPDFIRLVAESGIDPLILSAKMSIFMDKNNTDEWPSLEQLGFSNNVDNFLSQFKSLTPGIWTYRGTEGIVDSLDSKAKLLGLNSTVTKTASGDYVVKVTKNNEIYPNTIGNNKSYNSDIFYKILEEGDIKDSAKIIQNIQKYINDNLSFEERQKIPEDLLQLLSLKSFKVNAKSIYDIQSINKKAYMYYENQTITIPYNDNESFTIFVSSFIHELVHGYTVASLVNPVTEQEKDFAKVITQAYKSIGVEDYYNEYGFTNQFEFVSELLSNPKFLDKLMTDKRSLLNKIVDYIMYLFDPTFRKYKLRSKELYRESLIKSIRLIDSINKGSIVNNTYSNGKYLKERQSTAYERIKNKITGADEVLSAEKSNVLDSIEKALESAIKNLQFKLEHSIKRGSEAEQKYLQHVISNINQTIPASKELSELVALEGLVFALADAQKSIRFIHEQMLDAKKSGKTDAKRLLLWKNLLGGYKWLDAVKLQLNNADSKITDEFRKEHVVKELDNILKDRNDVLRVFKEEGLPIIARFLTNYSSIGEANLKERVEKEYRQLDDSTKEVIPFDTFWNKWIAENEEEAKGITYNKMLKELENASDDINFLERWFDTVTDSPDIVIGAASNAFSQVLTATNVQNLSVRERLLESVKALEKEYGKSITTDISKLYEFMIEVDSDGKRTGHYVTKYSSSLEKDIRKEKDSIWSSKKYKTDKERWGAFFKFKDEVAPRDDDSYYNARWDFIEDQFTNGNISEAEHAALSHNENQRYRDAIWKLRNDGRISPTTANRITEWEGNNDMTFREPIDKYKNKQFTALQRIAGTTSDNVEEWSDKDARIKFYKLTLELSKEADSKVIGSQKLGTRLPSIQASSLERIKQGQNALELVKNNLKQVLFLSPEEKNIIGDRTATDPQGQEHRYVPVKFTTRIDPSDMSFDIASLYMGYASSANKYANTMAILPELEMIRDFVGNSEEGRKVTKTDWRGRPLLNKPVGGIMSRIKDNRIIKSKTENNLGAQFEDWLNLVVYEEGMNKTVMDKAIAKLSQYTAFRVLSLNIMNGVTNILTGETIQKIEALSGQHLPAKSLHKASGKYDREIGQMLTDIGARSPSSVVNLLNERFRVLNEDAFVQFRKGTKVQQLFNTSKLFFMMHAGEHWMQSRFFMAMLDTKKALDKDGNPIKIKDWKGVEIEASLLDMYKSVPILNEAKEVAGHKLQLDSRVDEKKSKWTDADKDVFTTQFKGLSRSMHGAYSEEDRRAIDKYAIGRAVVQFRKFVVPGVKRRWSKKYYNSSLQEFSEGYYRTWGKWMKELGVEIFAYTIGLKNEEGKRTRNKNTNVRKILWQGSLGKDSWEDLGFTHYELANIKKMNMEIGVLVSTIVLASVLLPMLEGDDDEKGLIKYAKFATLRWGSEQMFFWNPAEFIKLMNSPLAAYSTLGDTGELFSQLLDPTEVYERGTFKGDNKLWHKFVDIFPIIRQLYKLEDITAQSSWLKQKNLINYFEKDKTTNESE